MQFLWELTLKSPILCCHLLLSRLMAYHTDAQLSLHLCCCPLVVCL